MTRSGTTSGRVFSVLAGLDRILTEAAGAVAVIFLALAATLGFVQVILRFILHSPSTWAGATTQLLVVWMVHLGVALTIRTGALVSVDFFRNRLGDRARPWMDLLVGCVMLCFFLSLVMFGWEVVRRVQFQLHPALNMSMSWGYAAVPVGAVFSVVATLARMARDLETIYNGKLGEEI